MTDYFLDVKGQGRASKQLVELKRKRRVPHALLFIGPEGVGKFFSAVQFIKYLNSPSSDRVSNGISKLIEPYIKLIMPLPRGRSETNEDLPTSKLSEEIISEIQTQISEKVKNPYHKIEIRDANNIKISSIRELNKSIAINYDEIAYRGIIINDAHKMSIEAQNAFLKNLEEPPEGIVYILITDKPNYLLTTIKSRCWIINFSPLQTEDLTYILESYFKLLPEQFSNVLPFSNGSITKAMFLIENNMKDYLNKVILILRYSLARKYFRALQEFRTIIDTNSVRTFEIIVDLLIEWFNDTNKQRHNIGDIKFVEYKETLVKFNNVFYNANINKVISNLTEYRNAPQNNVSLLLLTSNIIFEIATIGINNYGQK